jgi:Fe-S-cluster containining protein
VPADKWYHDGLRFACTQCGNCCSGGPGYVWLTRDEMEKIGAFRGLELAAFARQYVRRVGFRYSLKEKSAAEQYDCVFLKRANGQATCSIYPVRPLQCRTWPFWKGNLHRPSDWAGAAETCPGMNMGDVRPYVQIERIRTAKKWADLD